MRPPASLTVTPLARVSPAGAFTVEHCMDDGLAGIEGPTKAQPLPVGFTRVRLPVTASAPAGTRVPVTWNLRATLVTNLPLRAVPKRLSRTRPGARGM